MHMISVLPDGDLMSGSSFENVDVTLNSSPNHVERHRLGSSAGGGLSLLMVTRSQQKVSTLGNICEADKIASTDTCPEQCPYAAETKNEFCHFKCVKPNECGLLNTVENATIPDHEMMACRHCEVEGCLRCVHGPPGEVDEAWERCEKCMPGYFLSRDGARCKSSADWIFVAVGVLAAVLTLLSLLWYVRLACRPVVNQASLERAQQCRQRTMLLQSEETADGMIEHAPYPLTTNLMTTNVAGPGTILFFRFQCALLVWDLVMLLIWMGFVLGVSWDLMDLGDRPAKTPRELCAVVLWGRRRLLELVWTKVAWLALAYVFSFVGAILYGIQQAKLFAQVDNANDTMADFAAVLEGFAVVKGDQRIEDRLKEDIRRATSQEVVGVSVGWDYQEVEKELLEAIEEDASIAEPPPAAGPSRQATGGLAASGMSRQASAGGAAAGAGGEAPRPDWMSQQLLQAWDIELEEASSEAPEEGRAAGVKKLERLLRGLESAPKAFVVFATEDARDKAVESVAESGIVIGGERCTLLEEIHEPEGIKWRHLGMVAATRDRKLAMGIAAVLLSCIGWTVILYLPYAHYMASFSYANGDEPGMFGESIFVALVVGSQLGLFIVSSMAARAAQFHYHDDEQKCYIVFYNFALLLNLIMDIALQTILSYLQMVGVGAHVADGRLLGDLSSWQEIFESYPVQKSVGKLLFKYCWPCTFLIPFMFEPLMAQWLPYHLGKLLIRSYPQIVGERAEKALELGEMEQGRYADCMFNALLIACIPFIAPAYTAKTLAVFVVSHLYIYLYDHAKTLRYVTRFNFSSPEVHWFGQKLFAMPVGLLLGALVFKANQMSAGPDGNLGEGILHGYWLGAACCGAVLLHIVVHVLLLECWVARFADYVDHVSASKSYAEVARTNPVTYFSTNPVHCLRSKYLFGENPPHSPYLIGKEHLMKANPAIGSYFDGSHAKALG